MLSFCIDGHFEEVAARQLSKFGPAPKLEKPDREWHQIEAQQIEVKWLNQITDPLTQQMGGMYNRIERFVLQKLEPPTVGRGISLQYVQRPLTDPSRPWLWRKGSLAYWGQMELRLQQLLHQTGRGPRSHCQLQKLGWHLAEHWHPDAPVTCEGLDAF